MEFADGYRDYLSEDTKEKPVALRLKPYEYIWAIHEDLAAVSENAD